VTVLGDASPGNTISIRDGDMVVATADADSDGQWSAAVQLADGPHNLSTTSMDAAGNVSVTSPSTAITVDTTAPEAPQFTSRDDSSATSGGTVTLSGRAEAGSTIRLYDGPLAVATVTTDGAGVWSDVQHVADGLHTFSAVAVDAAGNVSNSSPTWSVGVDASAPDAPALTSPVDGLLTNNADVRVAGSAEPGTAVTVTADDSLLATTTVGVDGTWSMHGTLAEGTHRLVATGTDAAGNVSNASSVTVSVDTTAPSTPTVSTPGDGSVSTAAGVRVGGTAEAQSRVTLRVDGSVVAVVEADDSGAWSTSVSLVDDVHQLTAVATDAAGNTSATSAITSFSVDTGDPRTTDDRRAGSKCRAGDERCAR